MCSKALVPSFALVLLASLGTSPSAQYFGQNKVQYRSLDWSVAKTPHFDVYFHEGEREAALDVARMAERAYDRLSTILNHEIESKVPLILYASHAEFQQSNVTPNLIEEGTGGFTEFVKRRVTLPLTGSYRDLDHVLTHELVHAFQVDILSGRGNRSLSGPFQYVPPLWFMEGMAEYLSLGQVDHLTEMWLRDGALEGYLLPLQTLERVGDIRVYRYGQAVIAYLGKTFGDQMIGQVLKKVAHTHNLARAFDEAIGVTLEKFGENWMEDVRKTYLPAIREHEDPDDFAFQLTHSRRDLSNSNLAPALSPDGDHLVFFSDHSLYNDLYLASAVDGQVERRLVKGERKADFESLRFYTSSVDWSPDGKTVAMVALSGGRDALYLVEAKEGRILEKLAFELDGLLHPSWSPDGEWLVFSGLDGGRSNLYRVRKDGSDLEQLTSGRFMVQEPRYSPDGRTIVFVTDRGPGTDFENLLFSLPKFAFFDLGTRIVTLPEGQPERNISPHFFPDGKHLLFISDRSGISNLYIRDLETGEDRRVSNILTGITGIIPNGTAVSLSRNGKRMVFSAFGAGAWDLYAIKDPLTLWEKGDPWVPLDSTLVGPPVEFPAEGPPDEARAAKDTSPPEYSAEASSREGSPPSAKDSDSADRATPAPAASPDSALASAGEGTEARLDSLWGKLDSLEPSIPDSMTTIPSVEEEPIQVAEVFSEKRELPDPSNYEIRRYRPRFTADYVSANGFFSGNVGLAAQSVLQFSDILGDQIILIGADVYGSIKDSNLLFEYVNLKRRTNWGVSVYQFRNDFFIFTTESRDEFVSRIYRGVNLTLQRPFSRFRRVEWSIEGLGVSEEVFREDFSTGVNEEFTSTGRGTHFYVQPGVALVNDNTLYGITGPISGGRDRIGADVGIGDLSFHTYVGDVRRYLNIRHRYALALRAVGAWSGGRDPQYFRVGGPYTLRGYEFGEFRGTHLGLANVEFRFPLIEQLRLGWPLPLSLSGVRGALFFDAGATWTDSQEFQPVESHGGFVRFRDIRASYGLSTSINLGFTVLKWDLAWPTDLSKNLGQPRGFLSFGLDY